MGSSFPLPSGLGLVGLRQNHLTGSSLLLPKSPSHFRSRRRRRNAGSLSLGCGHFCRLRFVNGAPLFGSLVRDENPRAQTQHARTPSFGFQLIEKTFGNSVRRAKTRNRVHCSRRARRRLARLALSNLSACHGSAPSNWMSHPRIVMNV